MGQQLKSEQLLAIQHHKPTIQTPHYTRADSTSSLNLNAIFCKYEVFYQVIPRRAARSHDRSKVFLIWITAPDDF